MMMVLDVTAFEISNLEEFNVRDQLITSRGLAKRIQLIRERDRNQCDVYGVSLKLRK
jgi:hypothetical protein